MRALHAALLLPLLAAAPARAQQVQTPSALGQGQSVIAVPAAPRIVPAPATPEAVQAPRAAPPPGLVQTPAPPPDAAAANTDTGSAPPPATPAPAAPGAEEEPPSPPQQWVPKTQAALGVLDKVDGSVSPLSIAVGGTGTAHDLAVQVLACVVRPPDEAPDAAIYLVVTAAPGAAARGGQDAGAPKAGPPIYRGWLVRSEPGAAVVGDATVTFRVIGCS